MNNISFFQYRDIFIFPVLLFILYRTAYYYRANYYKHSEIGKFLLPALTFKIVLTVLFALIVEFYYKGGDLLSYYRHAIMLHNIMLQHPGYTFDLIFKAYVDLPTEIQVRFPTEYIYRYSGSTGYIPRISLPFTILSFGSYWGAGFAFAVFSFFGSWKIFQMFYEYFPRLKNQLAIAILFLPSVCFWCSGALKDALSFGGLTLFLFSVHVIFFKKEKKLIYSIIGITAIVIVLISKAYIILTALPCAFIWIFIELKSTTKGRQRKLFYAVSCIILPIIIGILYFVIEGSFASELYLSNTVLEEIQSKQEGYASLEVQNTFVTAGQYDGSISGLILLAPANIGLVFFRPFIWESSSVMMLFSAFESIFFTYLTFIVIWRYKFNPLAIIRGIRKKPVLIFCILFALTFGVVVGISTLNFGSISRYRIPALPFYAIVMFVLLDMKESHMEVKENINA